MTEKDERRKLDEFIEAREEIDRTIKLAESQKDPRTKESEKAGKDLLEYVHETAKKTIANYSVNDPKKLSPDYIRSNGGSQEEIENAANFLQEQFKFSQRTAIKNAANTFSTNLEQIINKEISEDKLETLARTKEIADNVPEKDKETLRLYTTYKSIEKITRNYIKGEEPKSKEERKIVEDAKVIGAAESQRKELKEKGYDEELQNIGAIVAARAARAGLIDDKKLRTYAIEGLARQMSEIKRQYEKAGKVSEIVRDTLKKLGKGNIKQFETAMALVYAAEKDKIEREPEETNYKFRPEEESEEEEYVLNRAA